MNHQIMRLLRAGLFALLLGAAFLATGCSAADVGASEGRTEPAPVGGGAAETVAKTSEPLLTVAWAYLRTPAARGSSSWQTINCSDCAKSSTGMTPQWAHTGTGSYWVKFPGAAPTATNMYVGHVTPYGTTGAECVVNGFTVPAGSNDALFQVLCTDNLGNDTNTRFFFTYATRDTSAGQSAKDMAMVGVRNNALNGWYVNTVPAPTLTRVATGQYMIAMPGLRQSGKGGNAQVTSWTKGARCSLIAWDASTTNGVTVHVKCATTFNVPIDAAFQMSYTKDGIVFGDPNGYVWMQDASNFTKQYPAPTWNKSLLGTNPDLLTSGMEVKRVSAGRYRIDFRMTGSRHSQDLELSTVGDASTSCAVLSNDGDFADIQCVNNGTPTNTQFSLRVGMFDRVVTTRWNLLSGVNMFQNYGAGFGMICGQVAIDGKQVQCGVATSPGTVTMRVTGPAAWPTSVGYVAVDNRDLTSTRVLVLGTDRVLRAVTGTLTKSWPASDNFATVSTVAQPTFNPGGASLSLVKIVVVRDPSANFVIGLTSDNRIVQLSGSQWVASSYPIPSGVTWATISGDIGSLNLLATDGRMYWSVRGQSSAIQVPALPNSLKAISFGGAFVITNSDMNSSGLVPCLKPKNSSGFYNCGSTTQRFLKYNDYGGWSNVEGSGNIPLTNGDSVLTDGNPLTDPPAVEDARLVFGDMGKSLFAFHYNARLYYFLSSN